MNPSVVIYGPQGCGKSVNAQRLRRHFGLTRVVDDVDSAEGMRIPDSTLVLVHATTPPISAGTHLVISFKHAMRLAGFTRVDS